MVASALIKAVQSGKLNAVKRAVGACIDINAPDADGRTALHHAGIVGNFSIVEYLLANDAIAKQEDAQHKVAFQLALEDDKMTVERAKVAAVLLHATKGVLGRDTKGWTPLHWAILAKDRALIDKFLDAGATMLRYGPMVQRQHAVEVAFLVQDQRLLTYVLDRYEEQLGDSALPRAINIGHDQLVHALLARGHAQAYEDDTSLIKAAVGKGSATILEALFAHGVAAGNAKPLLEAASGSKHDLVRILIANGTPIHASTIYDWQVLVIASLRSGDKDAFTKTVEALVQDANFPIAPAFASTNATTVTQQQEFAAIIEAFVDAGVEINARDDHNNIALHRAVNTITAHANKVRTLIKHGADIEARDNDGMTPLMLAATFGQYDIVRELLASGANRHATVAPQDPNDRRDALYYAKLALRRTYQYNSTRTAQYEKIILLLENKHQ